METEKIAGMAIIALALILFGAALFGLFSSAAPKTGFEAFSKGNFSVSVPSWSGAKKGLGGTIFEATSDGRMVKIEEGQYARAWSAYSSFKEMIANQSEGTEKIFEDPRMKASYKTELNGQKYVATKRFLSCDSKTFSATYFCAEGKCIDEERDKILDSMFCEVESRTGAEVETQIGKNFGFNDAELVDFINSNPYFAEFLKEFSSVNLVFESAEGNQEANAEIRSGKIAKLMNGLNKNAEVTIWLPLEETMNLAEESAQGRQPNTLELFAFAAKMRTDPPEVKERMIQKALGG